MVRVVCPTLALALTLGTAAVVRAQAPPAVRVELGEGIPDSLTGSTTIPFSILPEVCSKGHIPTVSLKIFNVLVQVVAIPALEGEAPGSLSGTRLKCGAYRVRWDGRKRCRDEPTYPNPVTAHVRCLSSGFWRSPEGMRLGRLEFYKAPHGQAGEVTSC